MFKLRLPVLFLTCSLLAACGNGATSDDDDDGGSGDDTADQDVDEKQTIVCGDSECDAEAESCCSSAGGSGTTFACIDRDASCSGGLATCDGREDCSSGDTCCITFGGGALPDAACLEEAECTGSGAAEACAIDDDCSGGQTCCPGDEWSISGGFCWPGGCP